MTQQPHGLKFLFLLIYYILTSISVRCGAMFWQLKTFQNLIVSKNMICRRQKFANKKIHKIVFGTKDLILIYDCYNPDVF